MPKFMAAYFRVMLWIVALAIIAALLALSFYPEKAPLFFAKLQEEKQILFTMAFLVAAVLYLARKR